MLQKTIKNRTIFCKDNIEILRGIDSNTIDLIYLDPPFNKKKQFNAPIGSSAEGASFSDKWGMADIKEEWVQTIKEDNEKLYSFLQNVKILGGKKVHNFCFLTYMAIRLIECHRVLRNTGSIYLHCDPTMSHYLKILMDIIFGDENFRREIIWSIPAVAGYKSLANNYIRANDNILYYCRSEHRRFNKEYLPYNEKQLKRFSSKDKDGRLYKSITKKRRKYLDEAKGVPVSSVWSDVASFQTIVNSPEDTGYPTQKPLALLNRIIKTSSNKGDVILDPFCGCATTCISAEKLGRKWIGIDVSVKAYELVKQRLAQEVADPEDIFQYQNKIHFSTTPPKRTDSGEDLSNKKYVYVISNEKYKNEYKIGIASNVEARLNSYQTSDPNRAYKLEFSLHTHLFREIEAFIREKFENRHEWVREDLEKIIKTIKNYNKKNKS